KRREPDLTHVAGEMLAPFDHLAYLRFRPLLKSVEVAGEVVVENRGRARDEVLVDLENSVDQLLVGDDVPHAPARDPKVFRHRVEDHDALLVRVQTSRRDE